MFEDSLIESNGQQKTKKGATVIISTLVHVGLITVLILIPLISYSELPKQRSGVGSRILFFGASISKCVARSLNIRRRNSSNSARR